MMSKNPYLGPRLGEPPAGGVTRADVVACAQSYVGVPWQHMGKTKRGVDCVGLLAAIWSDLRFTPEPDIPPYRREPVGSLLEYFHKYMVRIPVYKLKPGSALIFAYQGSPYHVGVVVDPDRRSMIHAYARTRKVVLDIIDHGQDTRKLICAWDYPGVTDG